MVFPTLRYPTKQQTLIWLRRRQKDRPSEIAKDLKLSRPFVSMEQKTAENRIKKLIEHTASVNRVKIDRLSARYGIAEGYCHAYDSPTYIIFSPKIGVQNWYVHEGECGTCDLEAQCTETLRTLAEEWEIGIPPGMPPTELGVYLFEFARYLQAH
ncbi:MAG: hypothetical protein AM324_015380 [Candidatus Thorarchaeota archaeon SMTZ1-83]|nr:MAG: hypothetical protein AM324_16500 [Candidatus Thorarchaeota archaeon SMTZ1-83]